MRIKIVRQIINEEIYKSQLKETIEEYDGLTFQVDWHDYHHGQADGTTKVMKDGKVVANADITKYEGKIFIKHIESYVKGFGFGQKLMEHLAKLFGYENLERSSLTPDGVKMRQKLDKKFDFDYDKHQEAQSKHLDPSIIEKIKHPMVKEFMIDMMNNGYDVTWQKWLQNPEFKKVALGQGDIDFNDVSEITSWIKGSKSNEHHPDEEPNFYILDDLKKLL